MLPAAPTQHTDLLIRQWVNKGGGRREGIVQYSESFTESPENVLHLCSTEMAPAKPETVPPPPILSLLLNASSPYPSPLSVPQRWKNSLDSLTAALSETML